MCAPKAENAQSAYNVSSAFALLCLFLELYMYLPYRSNQAFQQTFIAQSILSSIKEEVEVWLEQSKQQSSKAAILAFVPRSTKLEKLFGQKFEEHLNLEKIRK